MRFFGIQIGLLQIALQTSDRFVSHQLSQGKNIRVISQHGEREYFLEIIVILTPYQFELDLDLLSLLHTCCNRLQRR